MSSVEDRLADALAARARLEQADEHLLRRRREELAAGAAEDVVGLDTAVDHDDALAGAVDLGQVHAARRRALRVLAAAAAVVVLAAAALGVVRLARQHAAAPASSPERAYVGLARPQQPYDVAGSPFGDGSGVQPGSVRLLGQLDGRSYYAALDERGRLCWSVQSTGSSEGGCELETGPAEAFELSTDGSAVEAWLVPEGADTGPLRARGLVEATPSLWLPRDAAGPVADVFSVLGSPQGPSDAFGGPVDAARFTRGSERVLAKTAEATYWAATDPAGEVCLVVLLNSDGSAAASCRSPLDAAMGGVWLSTTGSSTVEAHLVPDRYSAAGLERGDLLRLPGARGSLWVDRATGEQAGVDEITARADGPWAVAPSAATGSQELQVPAGGWRAQVLLRCLTSSQVQVRVDGVVQGTGCSGSAADPVATAPVPAGGGVTVTVTGPPGATWVAGVEELSAE